MTARTFSGPAPAAQRVAVLYTSALSAGNLSRKEKEAEELTGNAHAIKDALAGLGHTVCCVDFGADPAALIARLRKARPDVVFNLAEAPFGCYEKEAHAAGLLELLGLPYTGNSPVSLVSCKNKAFTKEILQARGVPT